MNQPYRRDLSHLTWGDVFARQQLRAGLVDAWIEALQLRRGACVLDIGAGPGYVSLVLADRVGSDGLVCAVDRSADALAYLERLQNERGLAQIKPIVADATSLNLERVRPDSALITMVLHHADDPAGILTSVARLLPRGARAVVGEFHPDGPCEVGPPRAERIPPKQIRAWCEAAGFAVIAYCRQTQEHYMLTMRRC